MAIHKILVTGSSGMIGTRLCELLIAKGYQVVGVDRLPNKFSSAVQQVTVDVDLRDKAKTLALLPKDADLVVHLAANARVFDLVVDPDRARDNVETTFNVLEYVRHHGIHRFAFASSREVYGNLEQPVHAEGDERICFCESPYTASKIAGEALTWAYQHCYSIDVIVYRFSNVYGMYDESNRFIPLMIRKAAGDETMTIFGEDKLLDFTYIDDTVAGVIRSIGGFDELVRAPNRPAAGHTDALNASLFSGKLSSRDTNQSNSSTKAHVYNIAYGRGNKLVDVARMIKEEMSSCSEIVLGKNRPGEVVQYVADISKAQAKIGYEPRTAILAGVRKTVEWYRRWWNL